MSIPQLIGLCETGSRNVLKMSISSPRQVGNHLQHFEKQVTQFFTCLAISLSKGELLNPQH